MVKHVIAFIVVALALPTLAAAQAPEPGSRIQVVTTNNNELFIGTLVSLDSESLVMTTDRPGVSRMVSSSAIKYLAVGHHRSRGKTTLIGALVGLVAGMAVGYGSGDDPPGLFSFSAGEKAVITSIFTVPAGVLTGLLIGPSKERWTPVALSARTAITPVATRHSIGIRGSVRW